VSRRALFGDRLEPELQRQIVAIGDEESQVFELSYEDLNEAIGSAS
jgi:hypothetical protein